MSFRINSVRSLIGLLCAGALFVSVPAIATHVEGHEDAAAEGGHAGHDMTTPAGGELSEASKAYDAAMHKMHKSMSLPYTNDVDIDFVRGMIPHHQGAIEQAEVLLKYSKNPRLRRLAGGIIAAQKREIRFMEKWLKENAEGVETGEMPDWLRSTPEPAGVTQEAAPAAR